MSFSWMCVHISHIVCALWLHHAKPSHTCGVEATCCSPLRPHSTQDASRARAATLLHTTHMQNDTQVCATKKVCRYHPAEVKTGMAALARAQEQLQAACASAWSQLLRDFTAAHHTAFRAAVAAVAQLDALYALAVVASSPGYCRPQVNLWQQVAVIVQLQSHPHAVV